MTLSMNANETLHCTLQIVGPIASHDDHRSNYRVFALLNYGSDACFFKVFFSLDACKYM